MKKYLLLIITGVQLLSSCMEHDLCLHHDHPHTGVIKPEIYWNYPAWENEIFSNLTYQYYGQEFFQFEEKETEHKIESGNYYSLIYTSGKNAVFTYTDEIDQAFAYTEIVDGMTRQPGFIFSDYQNFNIEVEDTLTVRYQPLSLIKVLQLRVKVTSLDAPDHIIEMDGSLSGCATSVNLYSREKGNETATIPFRFDREWIDDTVFTAQVTTFGASLYGSTAIDLELYLHDGAIVRSSFDLTSYFWKAEFQNVEVISCTLNVDVPRSGIDVGTVTVNEWEVGSWDNVNLN